MRDKQNNLTVTNVTEVKFTCFCLINDNEYLQSQGFNEVVTLLVSSEAVFKLLCVRVGW